MNLRPLEDRVIVEPAKAEEVTKSGIVLPDTAQEKPQRGTVLAVGPGKMKDDGDARAGGRQGQGRRHLQQVRRHRREDRGRGLQDPSR